MDLHRSPAFGSKMKQTIAVLGDMLELGPDAPRRHSELVDAINDAKVDLVLAACFLD